VSKAKQKGTAAETAVVNYLKSKGRAHIERRSLNGSNDRGDIAGIPGVVIEVKNHARMELSQWLSELEVEMRNDKASTGVVIHKKKGTTEVGQWYATMPVDVWHNLIGEAEY
jgi:Holliday junction resolvase